MSRGGTASSRSSRPIPTVRMARPSDDPGAIAAQRQEEQHGGEERPGELGIVVTTVSGRWTGSRSGKRAAVMQHAPDDVAQATRNEAASFRVAALLVQATGAGDRKCC